jgi:hypothetical protein
MLEKQLLQKEYFTILVNNIKYEKLMIELEQWIGWNKKKKEVLQLLLQLLLVFGMNIMLM